MEDEQADKEDVDRGGNEGTRGVNVTSVHVDEVVTVGEPTKSKVGETEGQDQRSDDTEGDCDDKDQQAEGNVGHVRVVANDVLIVSVLRALTGKV